MNDGLELQTLESRISQLVNEAGLSENEARELLTPPTPASSDIQVENVDDPNLQFLLASFPNIPVASLKARLRETNNDIVRATDLLLNHDIIDDVREGSPQHFDRQLQRKAKLRLKRQRQLERQRDKSDIVDIEALAQVLGVTESYAAEVYDRNDRSLSNTLAEMASPADVSEVMRLLDSASLSQPPSNSIAPKSANLINNPLSRQKSLKPTYAGDASLGTANDIKSRLAALYREIDFHSERAKKYGRGPPAQRPLAADSLARMQDARDRAVDLEVELDLRGGNRHIQQGQVDLHGLTATAAERLARRSLERFSATGKSKSLEIVTGAGNHSIGNKPVLKKVIRELLDTEGYSYRESDGSFLISRPPN